MLILCVNRPFVATIRQTKSQGLKCVHMYSNPKVFTVEVAIYEKKNLDGLNLLIWLTIERKAASCLIDFPTSYSLSQHCKKATQAYVLRTFSPPQSIASCCFTWISTQKADHPPSFLSGDAGWIIMPSDDDSEWKMRFILASKCLCNERLSTWRRWG